MPHWCSQTPLVPRFGRPQKVTTTSAWRGRRPVPAAGEGQQQVDGDRARRQLAGERRSRASGRRARRCRSSPARRRPRPRRPVRGSPARRPCRPGRSVARRPARSSRALTRRRRAARLRGPRAARGGARPPRSCASIRMNRTDRSDHEHRATARPSSSRRRRSGPRALTGPRCAARPRSSCRRTVVDQTRKSPSAASPSLRPRCSRRCHALELAPHRHGLDERPPEREPGDEERGVLETVDERVLKRRVVQRRDMPEVNEREPQRRGP